jgi:hypothetical protein
MDWILFKEQKPKNKQHVYYYFDVFDRIYEGYYEEYYHEELGSWEEIFYGKHGFLGDGEVTHWTPYVDELPDKPNFGL